MEYQFKSIPPISSVSLYKFANKNNIIHIKNIHKSWSINCSKLISFINAIAYWMMQCIITMNGKIFNASYVVIQKTNKDKCYSKDSIRL